MPIPFRRIRTRVMLVFLLLLAIVLGAVLVAVYHAGLANAEVRAAAGLDTAARTLTHLLAQRAAFLRQGAEVLAGDAAFRRALRDAELTSVEAALASHATRFKADLAMLVSLDGRVLVDARFPEAFGKPFPCPRMVEMARKTGNGSGYVRIAGQTYQVALAPVLSPRPVAWVALGLPVNDASAAEFQTLSGVGVSFLSVGDEGTRVLTTSLAAPLRKPALEWLSGFAGRDYTMGHARIAGAEYRVHYLKLDSASALGYVAALTLSLDDAMTPYRRLLGTLLVIAALALLAAWYGAVLLARRLTQPIYELTLALRRVGRGRYETRVQVTGCDELAELAQGFNRMAGDICAREQQIAHLAQHDVLTGLPNRASFVAALNQDLADGRLAPGMLLVASLGRLRAIDMSLGFAVADGLIKAVVQRLKGRDDWRVASLGGEKFAFYCALGDGAGRDDWEARVRAVLEAPLEWDGQRFDLGMHLGSARYPQDGGDAEILLRRAELAMQLGNHTMGTHVAWQAEFDADAARRLALLDELGAALEAGQLLACYQPKTRLTDGRVVACELLLCWRHPGHGLLFAQDFIPAAEQCHLIRPLMHWVIDTAAAQAAAWRAAGHELAVAVNLSARNLADHDVVAQFTNALERHQLPPAALIAEITEGALMEDTEIALGVLDAIAALGMKLSIDGFGTGHFSLAQLSRLPVHALNIDQSFVLRMLESAQDAAIVKSSIDLAHTLGLFVVAEGVETEAHWQRLAAYGCDLAQGHHLSQPLEAVAFEAWLAEREGTT